MGSSTSAVNKSTMAKPMRKNVVELRNIFNGSTKKTKIRRLLAKIVISEHMMIKIEEPNAAL